MTELTIHYGTHVYDLRQDVLDQSIYYAAGYTIDQLGDLLFDLAAEHRAANDDLTPGIAGLRERVALGENLRTIRDMHTRMVKAEAVNEIAKML